MSDTIDGFILGLLFTTALWCFVIAIFVKPITILGIHKQAVEHKAGQFVVEDTELVFKWNDEIEKLDKPAD